MYSEDSMGVGSEIWKLAVTPWKYLRLISLHTKSLLHPLISLLVRRGGWVAFEILHLIRIHGLSHRSRRLNDILSQPQHPRSINLFYDLFSLDLLHPASSTTGRWRLWSRTVLWYTNRTPLETHPRNNWQYADESWKSCGSFRESVSSCRRKYFIWRGAEGLLLLAFAIMNILRLRPHYNAVSIHSEHLWRWYKARQSGWSGNNQWSRNEVVVAAIRNIVSRG